MASHWINYVLAAVLVAMAVAVVAEENVNMQCMRECYFDCTQIKIFSESECKKECVLGCARYFVRKAAEEDDDNNKIAQPELQFSIHSLALHNYKIERQNWINLIDGLFFPAAPWRRICRIF
ncbi:plant thionin family protein [Striga asiatica]|uniref:Plant thionin family protein n=1 Tax=Striga asiatica TaxID=4170 RepID=A0A5A7QH00_STRAF|nr:plant thionin family protein [Striga asiatica]